MSSVRKLGDILLDLEQILDEMVDSHELQFGDILALTYTHLEVHRPDAKEQYISGGNPKFYYGPEVDKKRLKKRLYKELKKWENSMIEVRTINELMKIIEEEYK